ncbi:MAG: hypothetical protein NTX25_15880, partial [Proteobacteria bacterium]|nr:hypothetical protein [Pseudomonadota bacterium]
MHSRLGLIACVSLILMSCFGPKTKLPEAGDFSFFKNPDSNRACLESNLSQWQLSGEFLHKLLRCASNRNADGGETLPASLRLLEEFDANKMQAVLNFVLLPDPKAHSHEARYPYLLALSTVMDRGLTQARQDGLELSSSRLLDLQDFLKEFDPSRSKKLLTLWSQSGHLDQILAELGLFLETLEHDSLSALSHELLAGKSLGPHLLALGSAAFEAEELMSSLDAAMSVRPLQSLTKGDQSKLLDQWRQPRSQDAPLESLSKLTAEPSPATSFAAEMSRFSQSLQETDIRGFSQFLLSFWNAYRNLPEADRIYMGDRLVRSLDEGLGQQQNPMQWLLSIANDLSRMPASDLNSISDTLGRLLEPANDPTLDTLRSKIWSSQMQEALQELLVKGGPVPGCQDFVSPGLQNISRDDFTESYAILRAMNQPQAGCQNQAPLKRAIETWSNFSIGRPCPATDAQCLELKERERDKDLSQSYWTAAAADINPELLQKLLKDSLVKARSMLEDDAFAWRNLGLARVALQPSAIDELLQSLQENNLRSVEDLAKWEGQLLQNPKWRDRLQSDPIEKLLALRISSLSSLSQEFHDLVPLKGATLDKASNQRAARIFAGIYNEGPLEAAVRSRLSTRAPDVLLRDPQLAWPEEIG